MQSQRDDLLWEWRLMVECPCGAVYDYKVGTIDSVLRSIGRYHLLRKGTWHLTHRLEQTGCSTQRRWWRWSCRPVHLPPGVDDE